MFSWVHRKNMVKFILNIFQVFLKKTFLWLSIEMLRVQRPHQFLIFLCWKCQSISVWDRILDFYDIISILKYFLHIFLSDEGGDGWVGRHLIIFLLKLAPLRRKILPRMLERPRLGYKIYHFVIELILDITSVIFLLHSLSFLNNL